MEINYFSKLSLTERALTKVIVVLLNQNDILNQIAEHRFESISYYYCKELIPIMESEVSKLELPQELKKQLMKIVKPICYEIQDWKVYHESYLEYNDKEIDVPILKKLCWTALGTVDYKKTAVELINCEMLNIVNCYKMASLYCIEELVIALWAKLSEDDKNYFYFQGNDLFNIKPSLKFCWPYILKGEEFKLESYLERYGETASFYQYAFQYFSCEGNKSAAEYFWSKIKSNNDELLTQIAIMVARKREESDEFGIGFDLFPIAKFSEVMMYLLSLMAPEQQIKVYKERFCSSLICFLDWPMRSLFLDFVDILFSFLPTSDYEYLTRTLWGSYINSNCSLELFQKFFMRCPMEYRKYFVEFESKNGCFIQDFAMGEDFEAIKVVFRNVDSEDRVKLVSSHRFYRMIDFFTLDGKWQTVEVFLREANLSEEDKIRFKSEIFTFLPKSRLNWKRWKKFFQLFDYIYGISSNEPIPEVETLTNKAKRRRILKYNSIE